MKRFKIFYVDSIDQDGNEVIHHVFINAMNMKLGFGLIFQVSIRNPLLGWKK